MNWYFKVIKQYADFKGRAGRKEFWYFQLFNIIAAILIGLIGSLIGLGNIFGSDGPRFMSGFLSGNLLHTLYNLFVLVPSLAVGVRRLHDTNRRGWWLLLWLFPIVGWIWSIILFVQDGQTGANDYGADPKEPAEPQ